MPAPARSRHASVPVLLALVTGLSALLVVAAPPSSAAPAWDDLADAGAVGLAAGAGTPLALDTVDATTETGEDTNPCAQIKNTVWVEFTALGDSDVVLTARTANAAPGTDTVLAAYTDSDGTPGYPLSDPIACNDDRAGRLSEIRFLAEVGTTYYLQVGLYNGTGGAAPGPLELQLSAVAAVANDDIAHATELPGTASGALDVDTTGATTAPTDPDEPVGTERRTLWYRWTAPGSGTYTFLDATAGTDGPDTFLYAFADDETTTDEDALAYHDDLDEDAEDYRAQIVFTATAGSTYWILAGTRGLHGSFPLSWAPFTPAATTTDLEATPAGPGAVDLDVTVAETGTTPPVPGRGTVRVSDGATVLGSLELVDGEARERIRLLTAGPHTYTAEFVPQSPRQLPDSDAATATVAAAVRPVNDDFADATALAGGRGRVDELDLLGATREAGDAIFPNSDDASVWFRWTAPVSDTYTFEVSSSDARADTVIGAYRGPTLRDLVLVGTARTPSGPGASLTFAAVEGRTYHLVVDAYEAGPASLSWSRPGNDSTTVLTSASSPAPYEVELQATVTGADEGTVVFLRDGELIDQVDVEAGVASTELVGQRPGPSEFSAEFYPADPAVRPSASESVELEVEAPDQSPVNDEFADAQLIASGSSTTPVAGTTYGATPDPGTPPSGLPGNADTTVWYRWVAPADGSYRFEVRPTPGTESDTVVRAFDGATLATLRLLAENDDASSGDTSLSRVGISAVGGRTYHVAVDAYSLRFLGGFTLTWQPTTPTTATTTALTAAVSGRTVTLRATVTEPRPGLVRFLEGTAVRREVVVTATSGPAVATLTNVAPGAHTYRARFVPDDASLAQSTSPARSVTVPKSASRTTLAAPARVRPGARPTVTATVKVGTANAAGSVRFTLNGRPVRTVALRGGRAAVQLPALAAGTARVVASYLGNGATATSTASRSIAVRR